MLPVHSRAVLWYLWTITWILLNELEIGNCKLNVIWLYVLKLYAQIVANREVCAMRTILMHYRNHVDCQRKELTLTVPQDAVRESGLCHTLLKYLNAHKTDQCWNVCRCYFVFLPYREHLLYVLKKVTILKASKNQGTRCRKKGALASVLFTVKIGR